MRTQAQSLALFGGLRTQRCHELRCRLQMWLRSGTAVTVAWATAAALIQPLAGERPYATCMALKKQKAEEKKKDSCNFNFRSTVPGTVHTHIHSHEGTARVRPQTQGAFPSIGGHLAHSSSDTKDPFPTNSQVHSDLWPVLPPKPFFIPPSI